MKVARRPVCVVRTVGTAVSNLWHGPAARGATRLGRLDRLKRNLVSVAAARRDGVEAPRVLKCFRQRRLGHESRVAGEVAGTQRLVVTH